MMNSWGVVAAEEQILMHCVNRRTTLDRCGFMAKFGDLNVGVFSVRLFEQTVMSMAGTAN